MRRLEGEVVQLRTGDAQVEMIIPDTYRVQTFGLNRMTKRSPAMQHRRECIKTRRLSVRSAQSQVRSRACEASSSLHVAVFLAVRRMSLISK